MRGAREQRTEYAALARTREKAVQLVDMGRSMKEPQIQRVFVVFMLLMCGCMHKQGQQPIQGEVVKTIRFEGNGGTFADMPDSALRGAMSQRQSTSMWWMDPASRAQVLDGDALSEDAWRIETFYANHGYFNARVRGWDVITLSEGDPTEEKPPVVEVVGHIVENKPSVVRSIEWEGLGGLKRNKRTKQIQAFYTGLLKKSAIQIGDRFTTANLRSVEDLTLQVLHEKSYGFATVKSTVDAYPDEHQVDITVVVERGPSCKFGEVQVEGAFGIPRSLVLEQVTIKEGRAFKAKTLADTQRRLFGLGVFSVVNLVPDLSMREQQIIPVTLHLAENKYRQVRVGGGFLLENGKQDVHGTAEFEHVNVMNRLWNFTASVRPGCLDHYADRCGGGRGCGGDGDRGGAESDRRGRPDTHHPQLSCQRLVTRE
jgi:outer membrane protein assembly factor BamA